MMVREYGPFVRQRLKDTKKSPFDPSDIYHLGKAAVANKDYDLAWKVAGFAQNKLEGKVWSSLGNLYGGMSGVLSKFVW